MKFRDLKALVAKKNLTWQYGEDLSNAYLAYATDGFQRHEANVFKDVTKVSGLSATEVTEAVEDLADFEANIKPIANFAAGVRTNPFATPDFDYAGDAVYDVCPAGQATNLDYKLGEDLYIDGGVIVIEGSVMGDWVEAVVLDRDGTLPAPYTGATLKVYIKKRYVPASPVGGSTPIMAIKTPYAGKILKDLVLRVVYHSTGSLDVKVGVNLDLHRQL